MPRQKFYVRTPNTYTASLVIGKASHFDSKEKICTSHSKVYPTRFHKHAIRPSWTEVGQLKKEVSLLNQTNGNKWRSPSFVILKNNGSSRFVKD